MEKSSWKIFQTLPMFLSHFEWFQQFNCRWNVIHGVRYDSEPNKKSQPQKSIDVHPHKSKFHPQRTSKVKRKMKNQFLLTTTTKII